MKSSVSAPFSSRNHSAIVSAGQRDACARTRRLVHLSVDKRRLVEDLGLLHLAVEGGALTGALTDPGEDRVPGVLTRDVADHLHDDDRLADSRSTEESDLRAFREGADEVDDLDAGLEDLRLRRLLGDGGRGAVHRHPRSAGEGALAVDGVADDVEHAPERFLADGNLNRRTRCAHGVAAAHTFSRVHRNRAHRAVAQALLYLEHEELAALAIHLQRVKNLRQASAAELHVHDRPDHLHDCTGAGLQLHNCHLSLLSLRAPRRRRRSPSTLS